MSALLKVKKSSEIVMKLSSIAASGDVNEIAVANLEREAKSLMRSDPHGAHTALGAIASIRGDVDKVHRCHAIAIQLSPRPAEAYYNYGRSLVQVDDNVGALAIVKKSYEIERELQSLSLLIEIAFKLGFVPMAKKYADEYFELSGRKHHLFEKIANHAAPDISNFLDETEDEVFKEYQDLIPQRIEVTEKDYSFLLEAINNPPEPNGALKHLFSTATA